MYCIGPRSGEGARQTQLNNTLNRKSHKRCCLGFVEIIAIPRITVLRGVFLANHLASIDNLTRTTTGQNTYKRKLTLHKKQP